MAYVPYESIVKNETNSSNKPQIQYFSLKNDGDEAIVRFIYDTKEQMDILTVHDVVVGKYHRKISCLRNPSDPVATCPFCVEKTEDNKYKYPLLQRFYVKLIQYVKAEDGSIVAVPKIWERPTEFAQQIYNYIQCYAPFSDTICKIVRRGEAGSLKTKYDIIPNLSKNVFPDSVYVKDFSAFNNYKVLGGAVMSRGFDDCCTYVATGNFPFHNKDGANTPTYATNVSSTASTEPAPFNTPVSVNGGVVAESIASGAVTNGSVLASEVSFADTPVFTAPPTTTTAESNTKLPWEA